VLCLVLTDVSKDRDHDVIRYEVSKEARNLRTRPAFHFDRNHWQFFEHGHIEAVRRPKERERRRYGLHHL
jgi:hypothetical protein